MKFAVWLIAFLLAAPFWASQAAAQDAEQCSRFLKRLERQDRIDAAFQCDRLRTMRDLQRTGEIDVDRCRRQRARTLRRLVLRRARQLELCIDQRLTKATTRRRQTAVGRRPVTAREPGARPSPRANSGRGDIARRGSVPGDAGRDTRADLIRDLLAKGPKVRTDDEGEPAARRSRIFRSGLVWSYAGPIEGMTCVQWKEPSDPHNWDDNFLCTEEDVGFQWSFRGPILGRGLKCIQVREKSDPHDWHDNYFCWPRDLNVNFKFSSTGRVYGYRCLAIVEPSDPHTWRDNYLCHRPAG